MAQSLPDVYRFNPADPRSPSPEQWRRMSANQRPRILALLEASVDEVVARKEDAERRASAEAARADAAELRLAEALAEIARLKQPR